MLRAVLFDFDGLILDTETPEVQILKEVFAEHGQEFPDSYWIHAFGRGADQILEKPMELLQRLCGSPKDVEALEKDRRARTVARIEQEPIRPGIEQLIIECKDRKLHLGIASSSHHWWVDGHLKRLGLFDAFDKIVCADDVSRAKPFPDLYLKLMEELGVTSADCIALEDSPNGTKAAKAAGLFTVAIENPLSKQLDLSHADRVIPSLSGLGLDDLSAPFSPTESSSG